MQDHTGRGAGPVTLTRTHRLLIAVVVCGAVVIAGIGFAGSYSAVRDLARDKGFGSFAHILPIGIDAGIAVLLALDLLLTWLRIPFPLLRHAAWLLTAATIAFNAAVAWPDPIGVGMHAVIPVLFVVTVEAARHAVARLMDLTGGQHMESVRRIRWLLAFLPTFKMWRRMRMWEQRSYERAVQVEQGLQVEKAKLRARHGRWWRRKATRDELFPLYLVELGLPLNPPQTEPDATSAYTALPAPGAFPGTAEPALPPAARAEEAAQAKASPEKEPEKEPERKPEAEPIEPRRRRPQVKTRSGHRRPPPPRTHSGSPASPAAAGASQPEPDGSHAKKLREIRSDAEAVRYAMATLGTTEKQQLASWLTQHGRAVNRGTVHRVTQSKAP
ncbi:DUF2637 domain-containing protein [Streptomyces erythrochromogenes]|uniref:DUF2637 domain-containing protein n=1 Tax=Streptomyces erythrochromogenes TaxID=285574 RepID=UPI00343ED45B